MLFVALDILEEGLNNYLSSIDYPIRAKVDNIAKWDITDIAQPLNDHIILTLLKAEEESTLKNASPYITRDLKYEVINPSVNLNLYVLFSANLENYKESLSAISKVIEFFQGKRIFTAENMAYQGHSSFENQLDTSVLDFRLSVTLFSPGFDELNNIWSMMGGRQFPSVFYKIQMIEINQRKKITERPAVLDVEGDLKNKGS